MSVCAVLDRADRQNRLRGWLSADVRDLPGQLDRQKVGPIAVTNIELVTVRSLRVCPRCHAGQMVVVEHVADLPNRAKQRDTS